MLFPILIYNFTCEITMSLWQLFLQCQNVTDYERNLSLMILIANQMVYSLNYKIIIISLAFCPKLNYFLISFHKIIWLWTKCMWNYSIIILLLFYKEVSGLLQAEAIWTCSTNFSTKEAFNLTARLCLVASDWALNS